MKQYFTKAQAWLNAHPKVKGGLIVAEGAALGALQDAAQAYFAGSHMTLKGTAAGIGIATYIAVKNYVAQNAGWKLPEQPK